MNRRKKDLVDQSYTLLGFLPVETVELGVENGDLEVDESIPFYKLPSSDLMPLEKFIPRPSWTSAREERITVPDEAVLSRLKPLK